MFRLFGLSLGVFALSFAKDERVRGTAAQGLLDRGWGKAKVER